MKLALTGGLLLLSRQVKKLCVGMGLMLGLMASHAFGSVTVTLTQPPDGNVYAAPAASIPLSATASAGQGYTLSKVEFFHGGTNLIGTDTTSPYSFNWTNVPAGTYAITAKATAVKKGAPDQTATSAVSTIVVNAAPSVSITSPAPNSVFGAPASLTIAANATDSDGSITQVQFFNNSGLLATVNSAPFSFNWNNVSPGSYGVYAVATDNRGANTTSTTVPITVTSRPNVIIVSPSNTSFAAPASFALTAVASDPDGSIAKVELFNNGQLLATLTAPPYTVNVQNLPRGNYFLTAIATDNLGITNAPPVPPAAKPIMVTDPPTVALTSPANNAVLGSPANITLTASASDPDGSISKVEFFQGTTLLATVTSAPYTHVLNNVASGAYTFTARATDNQNIATTSAPVSVTVNNAPTVSLTSPANNASFNAPASIAVTAAAQDGDGTITQVELFQGTTLIATLTSAPYTHTLNNVTAGNYTFTARATDNLGGITTSDPVAVTVSQQTAQVYYIHTDHLNTPRLIANMAGQTVWTWANDDPFGANAPNENPSGAGNFVCNLRLPGQYFDKETNLHYNYHRWYDPATGQYDQFDPIGLAGGINGYSYVRSNPLSVTDPLGLWSREAHNKIIHAAFPGLSPNLIQAIQQGSLGTDDPSGQAGDPAVHAMRWPSESVASARERYCKFIRENIADFLANKNSPIGTLRVGAYRALGRALHPIMDSTSPVHRGFQPWSIGNVAQWAEHGTGARTREDVTNLTPALLSETVNLINQLMTGSDPCPCGRY